VWLTATQDLGATALGVFVRRDLFHKCSLVDTSSVACGVGGLLVNKGAVAVALQLFDRKVRGCQGARVL